MALFQAVKKMDRQPSLCSQLSMMQVRNSMASANDTDDVLNQILRGGSAGSSRKSQCGLRKRYMLRIGLQESFHVYSFLLGLQNE